MFSIRIREGFAGQKQWVLPRSTLARWAAYPILRTLIPTDVGMYPRAQYHYRERPAGAEENILIYCAEGEGWCEVGGKRLALHPHEALLIPRGEPHTYGAAEQNAWSIHWAHFIGTEAEYFLYQLPPGEHTLAVDESCAARVEALFNACYNSFEAGFALHRLIYCAQILHHLLGCLLFDNRAFSAERERESAHARSIEPMLAFLQQNVERQVTLAEMAEQAKLSASQFSFLFKQQTGYSPVDYFIHLKMQHAVALLTSTEKSVHEIAYELGYQDPYYFSRLFKKVMGASPRRYRETPPG